MEEHTRTPLLFSFSWRERKSQSPPPPSPAHGLIFSWFGCGCVCKTAPQRVLTARLSAGPWVPAEWAPRRPFAFALPFWALFTQLVLSASGGSDGNDLLQMTSAVYGGCWQSGGGGSARGCAGSPPPPRPVPALHRLGIKARPPPRPPSLAQLPGAWWCLLARGFFPLTAEGGASGN